MLPRVPHAPVGFTIPKMLRPSFRTDRKLFVLLARTAYDVVHGHFQKRFPDITGAVPAMLASSQSFGALLNWHPHIHALVSLGVFDELGHFHLDLDVCFADIEEELRLTFLDRLVERGTVEDERRRLLLSWPHSGFGVHCNRVIEPGNLRGLERAIRYMERAPVSLERLTLTDLGMVAYASVSSGDSATEPVETGLEFLARLAPHVLHRYEWRLHTFGAVSTTHRQRFGRVGRHPGPGPVRPLKDSDRIQPSGDSIQTDGHTHDHQRYDVPNDDDYDTFANRRRRGWATSSARSGSTTLSAARSATPEP